MTLRQELSGVAELAGATLARTPTWRESILSRCATSIAMRSTTAPMNTVSQVDTPIRGDVRTRGTRYRECVYARAVTRAGCDCCRKRRHPRFI